ncbi:T9SS C-terminal target domain-containing protein, partial [bacterium]|nr:T9SS C-terminal target domain-containing protein [bacterium]
KWLYENGVPLVKVNDNKPGKHDKWPDYPYYMSENYKKYYHELIRQFSLFLRNQPKEKFECIAFVQVKTGATGDEEPYKGTAADDKYSISKDEWLEFRLEAFTTFQK